MDDLIWVGNYLIPRGTVIIVAGGIILTPILIAAIVSFFRKGV